MNKFLSFKHSIFGLYAILCILISSVASAIECPPEIAAFYAEGGEGTKGVAQLLINETQAFLARGRTMRESSADPLQLSNYHSRGIKYMARMLGGVIACARANAEVSGKIAPILQLLSGAISNKLNEALVRYQRGEDPYQVRFTYQVIEALWQDLLTQLVEILSLAESQPEPETHHQEYRWGASSGSYAGTSSEPRAEAEEEPRADEPRAEEKAPDIPSAQSLSAIYAASGDENGKHRELIAIIRPLIEYGAKLTEAGKENASADYLGQLHHELNAGLRDIFTNRILRELRKSNIKGPFKRLLNALESGKRAEDVRGPERTLPVNWPKAREMLNKLEETVEQS